MKRAPSALLLALRASLIAKREAPRLLILVCLVLWPGRAHAQVEGALSDRLAQALAGQGGLWFAYVIAYLAGLATSLTPCVYPLIPITVSLFGAREEEATRSRALGLAACYVGGIAVMYSALGVFFGLTGRAFGTFMVRPAVIIPIVIFFLAMAASMFGAFELGLPSELQGRLSRVGGKGAGGAFLMGLVAGVIAAPCTGPPLAVLLAFVSTQRSVFLGGSLLFVYALGMGMLFFAIAGFALKLPRSGPWMEAVKSVFGVAMVVAALYFLRNVAAPLRSIEHRDPRLLGASLAIVALGAALGAIHLSFHDGIAVAVRKGAGVLLVCAGLFGAVTWTLAAPVIEGAQGNQLAWLSDEAQALQQARSQHRPLLIDFFATWCLPCTELDHSTFSDAQVRAALQRFVLLRVDLSDPDDKGEAIKARYGAETLPTVALFDAAGRPVTKITEFTPPQRFLPVLQGVLRIAVPGML